MDAPVERGVAAAIDRVKVVDPLASHLTDGQSAFKLLRAFSYDSAKEAVQRILDRWAGRGARRPV